MMSQTAPRVLHEDDLAAFHENGYVVVSNVVPRENLEAVIAAIWQFLEMDSDDPSTWYPPDRRGSIVHIHQHQALWDNRQHPRVHQAFADILGTEKLWVSMDRAGMKPPIDARYPKYEDRGFVHWDLDPSKPFPERLGVQGVLALTDTTAEMGGFQCVSGFHRALAAWIAEQPEDRNPRSPDLSQLPPGFQVTPIPMKAGDLVIWDRLLAHGNGRNEGSRPRLAQYITMYPAADDEPQRQERIACWREGQAPSYWEREIPEPFGGRERQNPPAHLTPLGRKLLGLDSWFCR
jgi:ectoine hydroxylase-related dioxygenase (phytanoyl-CoA dioxygenase family)